MNNLTADLIIYIGDTHLTVKEIVQWGSINKKWKEIITNIIWPTVVFNFKIMDNNILWNVLTRHKFRKVDLSNTMITDNFGILLSHCFEVTIKNCFNLTDIFVNGLKSCHSLNATNCFNIKGSFMNDSKKWLLLDLNGCYQFKSKSSEEVIQEYFNINLKMFPDAPPFKDIFRGHPVNISYSETEKIISKYIEERTKYIEAFLGIDASKPYKEIIEEKETIIGSTTITMFKKVYNALIDANPVFYKLLYFPHTVISNEFRWKPDYSHYRHGLRLDQYIDDQQVGLTHYYGLNKIAESLSYGTIPNLFETPKLNEYVSITALPYGSMSNDYAYLRYQHDDADCAKYDKDIIDFIGAVMKFRGSTVEPVNKNNLTANINDLLKQKISENIQMDKEINKFQSGHIPESFFTSAPAKNNKKFNESLEELMKQRELDDIKFRGNKGSSNLLFGNDSPLGIGGRVIIRED